MFDVGGVLDGTTIRFVEGWTLAIPAFGIDCGGTLSTFNVALFDLIGILSKQKLPTETDPDGKVFEEEEETGPTPRSASLCPTKKKEEED